eukprot:TRINITY_DN9955_c0_g1_i1.p1 TRINITY_DN9955_c0_g1~~TRINITY_DN9955_c0_g1_i1.p1  ORF type:complete len:379 (-),score=38.49 TRINITY_DN9955_c0_g1_i1:362-1459(-)
MATNPEPTAPPLDERIYRHNYNYNSFDFDRRNESFYYGQSAVPVRLDATEDLLSIRSDEAASDSDYDWNDESIAITSPQIKKVEKPQDSSRKHWPIFLVLVSILDVATMGFSIWKNKGFESFSVNPMFGPSVDTLIWMGAKDTELIREENEWWRLVTPIFLHAGLLHILFNLLFQLQCFQLERLVGTIRMAILYIFCGIAGNLGSCIFLPELISVGASGALFGMIGVMVIDNVRNWSTLKGPFCNLFMLAIMIAISIFIGLLPYVDNFSHIGGLLCGLVLGIVLVPEVFKGSDSTRNRRKKTAAQYCAFTLKLTVRALALVIVVISFAIAVYAVKEKVPLKDWCQFCDKINCVDFAGQDWCDQLE